MKKTKLNFLIKIFYLQILISLIFSFEAYAYIGLGPLIPMLGSIIIYIFISIITIFGFIVYPLRLILKKIKNNKIENEKNKKKY